MHPVRKKRIRLRAEKIFESLEAAIRKSFGFTVRFSVTISIDNVNFSREFNARNQTTFTMESLILAQDER